MAKVTVSGRSKNLTYVINALRDANSEISTRAQEILEEVSDNLARQASAKVMLEPTHGDKHTGLRARIAAGVHVEKAPGFVDIQSSMAARNEAGIPRGMDTRASAGHGWRHPLFGNRDHWYTNMGAFSWFLDTMDEGKLELSLRLQTLLKEVAEQIAKGP